MEPRSEIKKIGWATNGGGWGMKFFKIYFNMEPGLYCQSMIGTLYFGV